jgi:hypothetical protein
MALDDPQTRAALGAYRKHGWMFTVLGFAAIVAAAVAVGIPESPNRVEGTVGLYGFAGGPVLLAIGLGVLWRSIRMRRALRANRWDAWPVRTAMTWWGRMLLLDGFGPDGLVYVVSGTKQHIDRFTRHDMSTVLFAGLPGRWVVATPEDRTILAVVRRPLRSGVRRKARASVLRPPLTPAAAATVSRGLRMYLFVLVPVSMVIPLTMVLVAPWFGIALVAAVALIVTRTVRRWSKLPRQAPPPDGSPG